MTVPSARPSPAGSKLDRRLLGLVAFCLLAGGLGYAGVKALCRRPALPDATDPPAGGVGTLPLFHDWPKDTKPDAVVILTGQTFGFLQPCGCSRPQMGGLERRANFMKGLRDKGWPVVGVDLGDVHPTRGPIGPAPITTPADQALLKYKVSMNALREMGYVAVGLGKTEFTAGLFKVLAEYPLQKEQLPFVLAGNVIGLADKKPVPREAAFPGPGARPMIGAADVFDVAGTPVGVAGVVGTALGKEAAKADSSIDFLDVKEFLKTAVATLGANAQRPVVNILLYQGPADHARLVAKDWPQFQVILCQSEDSEPPQFPEAVAHADGSKTLVIQVGHKGRYVGALGVFKKAGGAELKYQLVPLGEEYITANNPAAEEANPVLPLLQKYAEVVRDRKMLAKVSRVPHPAQIQAPDAKLAYVGSDKCAGCHAAEFIKWRDQTAHGHALDALEKVAKRPTLRNYDPECVVCHTVGFGVRTGYENEKDTPQLKHVGCESCHGPGSGHAAAPRDAALLKLMSPWKSQPGDKLPDLATFEKMEKLTRLERDKIPLPVAQQVVFNKVETACMKCHDTENDPHFDLYKYWPKVAHTGLAAGGGLPPTPKKRKPGG